MAKQKKTKSFTGIGRDPENKLVVQKSNPMTVLARSDLSLAELKILDMYLARIDTRKSEQRTVKLTKGQLEKALGVSQIKKDDLQQRLRNLYQPIDLAKDDKKRLHLISLFEEAEAEQDENGVWQITLTCTQSAMKYMFCVEEYGYFRYKLNGIVSLKSRYSLLLFMYLEKNRFRTPWEETLPVLKHELNCENDELYKEFKMFNQRILKQCQKELHEKTECRFSYEPIRKGRKVVSIKFTLQTLRDEIEGQLTFPEFADTIDDYPSESALTNDRDNICHGFSNPEFDDFTDDDLRALKELAWPKKRDSDVQRHKDVLTDTVLAYEYATADYLRRTIAMAKVYHPNNLYTYVKAMIENDK